MRVLSPSPGATILVTRIFLWSHLTQKKISLRMEGEELELPGDPSPSIWPPKKAKFVPGRGTHPSHTNKTLETFLIVCPVFPPLPQSFLSVWSSLCHGLRIPGMWNLGPSLYLPTPPHPTPHAEPPDPVREVLFKELMGRSPEPLTGKEKQYPLSSSPPPPPPPMLLP